MFESITNSLNGAFRVLTGKSKISEDNIAEAVREVRKALLEADVNLEVTRSFIERVREEALGEKVLLAVDPGEQFVKIVHDNLVELLGGEKAGIQWRPKGQVSVIMLCGLQGSGKTTTAAKLATRFKKEGRKPLLVAADVQRPAAIQQLQTLGGQIGVPVYADPKGKPADICRQAIDVAEVQRADTILLDTAGRLHVDTALMDELEEIAKRTNPAEILFVCDAMIGQSAVDTGAEFSRRLNLTGAVMTKLDSDARGGAALSLREVTGVQLKYVATGEKMDALEEFHPQRMAGRILGMGDVVSLVEKAQSVVDEKDAAEMAKKLQENSFTLEDFRKQLQQVRRMGSFKDLIGLLPGMGALKELDVDEREFKRIEAMIQSMTPDERQHPEIINGNRRNRVARGSGTSLKDVNDLLKQFGFMKKMVGKMGKAGLFGGGLGGGMDMLKGLMGGGGAPDPSMMAPGGLPGLGLGKRGPTKDTKDRKKERKRQKQARKKRRK